MLRTAIASLLLIGTIGCPSEDDDDGTGMDATPVDSGDDADSGTPDTGEPDGGMPGECNPTDGTGCPNANEYCVYNVGMNAAQCRTLPAMNAFESTCNVAMQDCAPGLACAQLQGEAEATCKQVCDLDAPSACEGLSGMSSDYLCQGLLINGQMSIYGVCRGVASCQPYDDTCPQGQVCSISTAQGDTACFAEGPNAVGAPCGGAAGNCMRGGICVDVNNQGARCHPPCDPANPMCAMGTCNEVANGWGICI